MGRLHERECDLTRGGATGVFAFIGALGYLTKGSEKHVAGELCLHFGNTLVVGSLKHSTQDADDGRKLNGTLYDVRTALPADEVSNQDMLEQGRIASHVSPRGLPTLRTTTGRLPPKFPSCHAGPTTTPCDRLSCGTDANNSPGASSGPRAALEKSRA
jgi:hypothetical protein